MSPRPTRLDELHRTLAGELAAARATDGGLPVVVRAASETEPTAIAALALDDERARRWLARSQRPSGGFRTGDGRDESPNVAAVAALGLHGVAGRRALAHAVASRARAIGESGREDSDGRDGWGWTPDAFSWVEPTSRILLATKVLRPNDRATRVEAVRLLGERQCDDGGWNYGNASVNGVDLRGYAQTTAVALIALQEEDSTLTRPALAFLRKRWRSEPGGLTLAQALLAFRLHGVTDVAAVLAGLDASWKRTAFLGNVLTLAWATLATAPDGALEHLRARA